LTNNTIPIKTKINGNNGISIEKGIKSIENNPIMIPTGIINKTEAIIVNNKNIILIGMLKIYKPAEKSFTKINIPNAIKRTENISI
jgi:hypothetical protein